MGACISQSHECTYNTILYSFTMNGTHNFKQFLITNPLWSKWVPKIPHPNSKETLSFGAQHKITIGLTLQYTSLVKQGIATSSYDLKPYNELSI